MQIKFLAVAISLATLAMFATASQDPTPSLGPGAAQPLVIPAPTTPEAVTPPVLARDDLEPWFDGLMRYGLGRADIAGAVVVVVKEGKVIFKKGYGYSDVARQTPVTADQTLFRPGSITKLFTWTAVMQLAEQGRIDLDRDVNAYLDFEIPPFEGRPVTMRDLMTHSAGFEDSYKGIYSTPDKESVSLERYIKRQIPARIYPAGAVTAYSNFGVSLAGYIVQRVSGADYFDYMERNVLAPLQMQHSTFRQPLPSSLAPNMSSGYSLASLPARDFEVIGPMPAGSLSTTAGDIANFMVMHLQNGEFNGRHVLQAKTAAEMHDTVRTTISTSLNRNLLGFLEMNRNGLRIIHHDGDSRWFHSQLMLIPSQHVGIFYSMNSIGRDWESISLRREINEAFIDRYFPPAGVPVKREGAQTAKADSQAHGRLLTGQYTSSRQELTTIWSLYYLSRQITVSVDDEGIVTVSGINGANGRPERFKEITPFVWRAERGQDRLAAKVVDGKVVMWSNDQDSAFLSYLPIPFYRNALWLLPLLRVAFAASLLSAVMWLVLTLRRRAKGASQYSSSGLERIGAATVLGCGLSAAVLVTWLQLVDTMGANKDWSPDWVPGIMALHVVSIAVFPLAFAFAIWNLKSAFAIARDGLSWGARAWNITLLLSSAVMLWAAFVFNLIGLNTAY